LADFGAERSTSELGKTQRPVGFAKDPLIDPGCIRAAAASNCRPKATDELRIQLSRRRRPVWEIELRRQARTKCPRVRDWKLDDEQHPPTRDR
jgi:hypothetical protein